MAHLPDGVLSLPVLLTGAAVSVGGCTFGLRRLPMDAIPQTAVLSAAFFVASLIHFPVGPASVHLILNGLTGIVLGWSAFPAIAVALILQAVLFGFGGVMVLGVNVMNMVVPALLCRFLFTSIARGGENRRHVLWASAVAGGGGVLLTAIMVASSLALSGREFIQAGKLVLIAHFPVALIEAFFSAAVISLLSRVRPEILRLGGESTHD